MSALRFAALSALVFAAAGCNGGATRTSPGDVGAVSIAARNVPLNVPLAGEELYVGSEGTRYYAQCCGVATQVVDSGTVMQTYNTASGDTTSMPYASLSTFGVSADRTQLIMGSVANGMNGSADNGIAIWDFRINRLSATFYSDGSQAQTASAFSGDNSKIYFADGVDHVYGYDVVRRAPLGP